MKKIGSDTPAVVTTRQRWSIQRARPRRRQHAERQRDRDGEEQAEQRQLERGRQARQRSRSPPAGRWSASCRGRRAPGRARSARTASSSGLSRPSLTRICVDRLLGRRRPGEVGRRVARQRARQQEGDDDDADQARHGASRQPLQHACSAWPPSRRGSAAQRALTPWPAGGSRAGGGTSTGSPTTFFCIATSR